jgi:hypothetical protein
MAFTIDSQIVIQAEPDRIFAVIMDMPAYREWSTLLLYHGGEPQVGQRLQLELRTADGSGFRFSPTVILREEGRRFAWRGTTGIRGIFDGEHHFELEPLGGGQTRLVNREHYSGLLSPIFQRLPMMRNAQSGFDQMNQEIKRRAESR